MLNTLQPIRTSDGWNSMVAAAEATVRAPDPDTAMTLLRCVIEHVDYGLALIDIDTHRLRLANTPALLAMSGEGRTRSGLSLAGGSVQAAQQADERSFEHSMTLARSGVRDLLNLGTGNNRTTVAVVPLGGPGDDCEALLIFAKRRLCDPSALALYARACDLTAAESTVLAAVSDGLRPHEVADQHGVQVSTIRSQLLSIRQKTRSSSIRELLQTVSLLPPMARHLN